MRINNVGVTESENTHSRRPETNTAVMGATTVAPVLILDRILDLFGLGDVADTFGTIPTFIAASLTTLIIAVAIIGGKRWFYEAKRKSQAEIASRLRKEIEHEDTSDTEIIEKINEEDNDILTEASRRLENRGEEIAGDNLTAVLSEIEEEMSEESSPTGLINEDVDRGPVARMSVAPNKVEEKEDYLIIHTARGEKLYVRTFFISAFPDQVTPGWMSKLFSSGIQINGASVRTSYYIYPRDTQKSIQELNKRATKLTSRIRRKRKEGDIDTIEEEQNRQKVNDLRDKLKKGATKLFDYGVYTQIVAEDEDSLKAGTEELKQYFSKSNARITPIIDKQLKGFESVSPLGQDMIKKSEVLDLESLGTTFPFIEPTRIVPSGVLYGFHQSTNSPVIVDRFELSGHNAIISGKIGSGKTYLSKIMMWRGLMMNPDTELLIIDPVSEFTDMVEAKDGQVITIDRNTIINPLEIGEAKGGLDDLDENPYEAKIRSVVGMFKTHFGGNLEKGEEGILKKVIKWSYLEKGITKNPRTHSKESPTMQSVIDILEHLSKGENPSEFLDVDDELKDFVEAFDREEIRDESNIEREASYAHELLLGMEDFTKGGQWSNLNGQSTINLNNKIVSFDIESVVDSNNASLILHIMLDFLFQRAKATDGKSLITIDEAHYLLDEQGPLNAMNTFVRHSRHYNAGLTLISQTVDEYMNDKSKEIYDQIDIRVLMYHEDIGDDSVEALGLTPPEKDFVLNAQTGEDADLSECLLHTSASGKRRLRVYSYPYEHHIIERDAPNVYTYLLANDLLEWENIPQERKPLVRKEMDQLRQQVNNPQVEADD